MSQLVSPLSSVPALEAEPLTHCSQRAVPRGKQDPGALGSPWRGFLSSRREQGQHMTPAQRPAPSPTPSSLPRLLSHEGCGSAPLSPACRNARGGGWKMLSKRLQNTLGAGDSLWGFPWLGQLSPALPRLWPWLSTAPGVGFVVPSLHPSYSSCSQNPGWAQWTPQFPPFPFEAAFPSPHTFGSGFATLSLKHPRHSQVWRCLVAFFCLWDLARAVFSLKLPLVFPVMSAPGREKLRGKNLNAGWL